MPPTRERNRQSLAGTPPLLISESRDAFNAFHEACRAEIKPSGPIERMYIDEFVDLSWESQRLRRWKATILDTARRTALQHLLEQLVPKGACMFRDIGDDPEDVSRLYFVNNEARAAVSEALARFQLDVSAIEAQALRDTLPVLDLIEKQLTSVEVRRDRALACLAAYRETLAGHLRETANRMLELKESRLLDNQPNSSIPPA